MRIEKLNQKFNVVEYVYLGKTDDNFAQLKEQLLQSRLEEYTPNDRYVIFDDDIHYYLDNSSFSLTWYNIIKTFLDIDVPLSSVIVFYNGTGLLEQILPLIPQELQDRNCVPTIIDNKSSCWITAIGGEQTKFIQDFDKQRTSHMPIIKHAISMMGETRLHRNVLQNHIKENHLFDKIAVAYNNVS